MAIALSGTSQFYLAASTPVTGSKLTMAVWGKPDADANLWAMGIGDSAAAVDYISLHHTATNRFVVFRSQESSPTTTGQAITTAAMTGGAFGHMCGTLAAANDRSVYLDGGNVVANTTASTPDSLDQIGIGSVGHGTPGANEWNGDLFWGAVWNTDLTASQVADLGNGFSPLTVQRQNLVFFARCAFIDPIDMIGFRTLTATGTPTNAPDPNGMRRVLPRGRGRSSLRLAA